MVTKITNPPEGTALEREARLDKIVNRQYEIVRQLYDHIDFSNVYLIKKTSSHLKSDAYWCAGAIGLIALGTRRLNRLRTQTAQHSIRWFKNPTLPIYAGLGIILCSTILKIRRSAEINQSIILNTPGLNNLRKESVNLYLEPKFGSTVNNKS